jgi:hypothetical protein
MSPKLLAMRVNIRNRGVPGTPDPVIPNPGQPNVGDPPGPQLEPEPNQPEIQEPPPAPVEVPQPGVSR